MTDVAIVFTKLLMVISNFSFLQGIIFPDGNLWKEQRRFAMKTLKQLGLGKNSLEHHIEVKALLKFQFSIVYI